MDPDGITKRSAEILECGIIEIRRALKIRFIQLYFAQFGDGRFALFWLSVSQPDSIIPSR
jgi:hypothetical protein